MRVTVDSGNLFRWQAQAWREEQQLDTVVHACAGEILFT